MTGGRVLPPARPAGARELVVASSYGPAGASTRVRIRDWLQFLHLEADVQWYLGTADVRPGTLARHPLAVVRAEARLRRLSRDPAIDRVLISRSVGPFTRGRVESALLCRAGWGVYDFDDALWADSRSGVHRFFDRRTTWARAVRSADRVIAGNEYLAAAAGELSPDVVVIPSCVDPSSYPLKQEYGVGTVPRIVWIGSPATEHCLDSVAPALMQVHRLTGARLTVVSAGQRPLGRLAAMTDRVRWDGARTHAALAAADCGIMPLPDDAFARGKCAYKLLQYGAAGLPSVASPVGVNARVIGQLHGLAAVDHDSWVQKLFQLLQEPEEVRRARGRAARHAVEQGYSFAAWRGPFLRALRLPDVAPSTAGSPRDEASSR